MRYIAIGILFIALTGCEKTYWVKPGATSADFTVACCPLVPVGP